MQPQRGAWVEVVCGPMFCGKSEELIRRLRRSTIARYAVVCVKPSIDDRHGVDDVISHAGSRIGARAISDPRELLELRGEADVVGIDEAQFFDGALVGVCEELASSGMTVICAGLDRDYRGLPFGPMAELLCRADRVTKLQSHFNQADGDIKNILISANKVISRSERIEKVDLAHETKALPRLDA